MQMINLMIELSTVAHPDQRAEIKLRFNFSDKSGSTVLIGQALGQLFGIHEVERLHDGGGGVSFARRLGAGVRSPEDV